MVQPFLPEPSPFSDRPLNKLRQVVGLHGNHQTVTNERNKKSKELKCFKYYRGLHELEKYVIELIFKLPVMKLTNRVK